MAAIANRKRPIVLRCPVTAEERLYSMIYRNLCNLERLFAKLESRLAALTDTRDRSLASIKETERRIADLFLVAKYATTYRKYKPIYDKYKRSPDKEKFLRGHESKIILFEAAARELKRLNAVPLPSAERINAELAELTASKERLYAEYTTAKQQLREFETIKQNIDSLLPIQKEPEQTHEIE